MRALRLLLVSGAFSMVPLIAGCGSDSSKLVPATGVLGGRGESCVINADCQAGLGCSNGSCGTSDDGGAPLGAAGSDAGPPRGEIGESCESRADCGPALLCVDRRCSDGKTPATTLDAGLTPRFAERGERCERSSDCAEGLGCVGSADESTCQIENHGLSPTGKSCTGECATAAQCCEVPDNLTLDVGDFGIYVHSCAQLKASIGGDPSVCNGAPTGDLGKYCFAYATYCDCASDTWTCQENRCVYTKACTVDNPVPGGCASTSRWGYLPTTCEQGSCQKGPDCRTSADCAGQTTDTFHSCEPGECACAAGSCYVACKQDLDCPNPYACDPALHSCVRQTGCASDAECATRQNDPEAVCRNDSCGHPCSSDLDCSHRLLSDPTSSVCSAEGICQAVGCTNDDDCTDSTGVRQRLCVADRAAAPSYRSATSN